MVSVSEDVSLPETDDVLLLHEMQLRRFGGGAGVRDIGLLESAVGRAYSYLDYAPDADAISAACVMAHSIARNHAFVDGNKRTCFAVLQTTLAVNGYALKVADPEEMAQIVIDLATGALEVEDFTQIVRDRVTVDKTFAYIVDIDQRSEGIQVEAEADDPSP